MRLKDPILPWNIRHIERMKALHREGKLPRKKLHAIMRDTLATEKLAFRRAEKVHQHRFRMARAMRNLKRFEESAGLEGTMPCVDEYGQFYYWDFNRNAIKLW
jgi:hypothetical protein